MHMYHFAWAKKRPVKGNISDIAREGGFFDPHFDLKDAAKETCSYIYSRACNFYLWYGVLYSNSQ